MWIISLIFACGMGCGTPTSVDLPTLYPTLQACNLQAKEWMKPGANQTHTVSSVVCHKPVVKK